MDTLFHVRYTHTLQYITHTFQTLFPIAQDEIGKISFYNDNLIIAITKCIIICPLAFLLDVLLYVQSFSLYLGTQLYYVVCWLVPLLIETLIRTVPQIVTIVNNSIITLISIVGSILQQGNSFLDYLLRNLYLFVCWIGPILLKIVQITYEVFLDIGANLFYLLYVALRMLRTLCVTLCSVLVILKEYVETNFHVILFVVLLLNIYIFFMDRRKRCKENTPPDHTECSICLQHISNALSCRKLKCNHYFHTKCIQKWRRRKATCPMCRKQI